jgi:hypothetical protein
MGEEDLRHVLLTALNTHKGIEGVAEAFNVAGKTDILVRHQNRNLFVAECKLWSGPARFAKGARPAVRLPGVERHEARAHRVPSSTDLELHAQLTSADLQSSSSLNACDLGSHVAKPIA